MNEFIELIDVSEPGSIIPVYLVPLTEEEDAEKLRLFQEEESRLAQKEAEVQAKQSAIEKLAQLGLTIEEAKAVIGIG